jgi:uracil-DNA glycosylase family 4
VGQFQDLLKQECAKRSLKYVGTRGNLRSPVCVVGESPGADEDQLGVPFVGSSGKELDRMLEEAGFRNPNTECWFTNPFKVHPPDNDLDMLESLGIPKQTHIDAFFEELNETQPRIIIACGATPLSILCPQTASKRDGASKITQWRGSLLSSPLLKWPAYVVPVLHPAAILREWGERQIAVLCLARACEEASFLKQHGVLQPLPQRELITLPPIQLLREFLHEAQNQKDSVSIDIETYRRKWPYTVAVAVSPLRAVSFSLWNYDLDDLIQVWRSLDTILQTHRQIGQNYIGFDCHQLEAIGFSPSVELVDDTMVRHHTLWPEFEHKLQFQGFQYTRQPFWKTEGKEWNPREGLHSLMHYNALDAAATYEIFNAQEADFDDRPYLRTFYNDYAIKRARAFYRMDDRGVQMDAKKLAELREWILKEMEKNCAETELLVGRPVVANSCSDPDHKDQCKCNLKRLAAERSCKQKDILNLASPKQLLEEFEKRKIKIPLKRGSKGKPSRKSVDEIALRKVVLNYPNEKLPFTILNTRELGKMKGTYVDAKLLNDVLYTSYVPTATVTGRSGSRVNSFGFGTNLQNLPKHSELGLRYRDCIVARPGTIFVACDQKGAEDWIVQGLIADIGGDFKGLNELRAGINRHKKLAGFLFAKPEASIDKAGIEYFLGKKTRHAGQYGMQGPTMSDNLLKEGFNIPVPYCDYLLQKLHQAEPSICGIYHKYVEDQLTKFRKLTNLLGRERIFFSLRSFSDNSSTFREGYAQIPQSTVADNTGMAIVYLDEHGAAILKDDHDSATLEVEDTEDAVLGAVQLLTEAFDRTLTFPNGLQLMIPIEVELGYTLRQMVTVEEHNDNRRVLAAVHEARSKRVQDVAISS